MLTNLQWSEQSLGALLTQTVSWLETQTVSWAQSEPEVHI